MDTVDVLFISSDKREFSGFLRYWTRVRPINLPVHWARGGFWKGKPVAAVCNGAGADCARRAAKVLAARVICNIGFCGALDPTLRTGDIVVAGGTEPRTLKPFARGRLICLDHVAQTVAEKQALRAEGGIAVDMESAGVPQAILVKSVSDVADQGFENDFNWALLPDGRISRARIIASAMQRPFVRFPELIRFERQTTIAARTLGTFLDSCEF